MTKHDSAQILRISRPVDSGASTCTCRRISKSYHHVCSSSAVPEPWLETLARKKSSSLRARRRLTATSPQCSADISWDASLCQGAYEPHYGGWQLALCDRTVQYLAWPSPPGCGRFSKDFLFLFFFQDHVLREESLLAATLSSPSGRVPRPGHDGGTGPDSLVFGVGVGCWLLQCICREWPVAGKII